GQATATVNTLNAGSHLILAQYLGDANENPGSGSLMQLIAPAPSTTVVTASPNPPTFGKLVTLTATVKPVAPATGTPTGSVTFIVDNTPVPGAFPLGPTGQATLTTGTLQGGSHTVAANYTPNPGANFLPSSSAPLPLVVTKSATTTTLTTTPATL